MSLAARLRDALRRDDQRVDADKLVRRIAALERFVKAAGPHVPAEDLRPANAVIERAGGRLALSRDHTVVALAGATGSGKSSLFNALTGTDFSTVGVRRPTTGVAHAFLWDAEGASGLLDWLGIPADRRFTRAGTSDDPQLRGLILLDLPDFDSIQASHRLEVDRLLRLVDLVVWVTDPQKYADQVIHEQYLRTFHRHVDSTVVVLNQADRLSEADVQRCLADLAHLLENDGFTKVPVMAVSAVGARPGTDELEQTLRKTVSERMSALRRLAADIDGAVEASQKLVGPAVAEDTIDRTTSGTLATALASSAGVPAVTEATANAYRYRARASMGWPLVRWIRRVRTDPLTRLRLGVANARSAEATSLQAPNLAQRSVADVAVRSLSDQAGRGLPPPWPTAVATAAKSHAATLPDSLDQAVVRTDLGMSRKPIWWRFVGLLQWILTVIAVAGGLWLLVRIVLIALGVARLALPSTDVGSVGSVPYATLALIGGAVVGILIALLVKPLVAIGAKRSRRRADTRLRASVTEVARDQVVAPVRHVLHDYAEAREALAEAAR
ncbi:MAG TPA: GTPase [Micromonosporaceae bacterium]|jgi:GTP-binding protein EngB required for normal cell division